MQAARGLPLRRCIHRCDDCRHRYCLLCQLGSPGHTGHVCDRDTGAWLATHTGHADVETYRRAVATITAHGDSPAT